MARTPRKAEPGDKVLFRGMNGVEYLYTVLSSNDLGHFTAQRAEDSAHAPSYITRRAEQYGSGYGQWRFSQESHKRQMWTLETVEPLYKALENYGDGCHFDIDDLMQELDAAFPEGIVVHKKPDIRRIALGLNLTTGLPPWMITQIVKVAFAEAGLPIG